MRRIVSSVAVVVLVAACTTIATRPFDDLFGPATPGASTALSRRLPGSRTPETIQPHPRPTLRGLPRLLRRALPAQDDQLGRIGARREQDAGVRPEPAAGGAAIAPLRRCRQGIGVAGTRLLAGAQRTSAHAGRQRGAGLMHRLLVLKQQHPLPTEGVVEGGLDLSLERSATCPAEAEIEHYERATPQGGMPFGLPGLSAAEHRVLTQWLEQGAPYEGPAAPTPLATQRVARVGALLQWRLAQGEAVRRYIYEHLFLAHLYFEDVDPERPFFRLVRSRTPPGHAAVDEIPTRASVRRPGRGPVLLPARAASAADRREDAHAVRAERRADARATASCSSSRTTGRRAAVLRAGDRRQSVSRPSRRCPSQSRYRFMLDEAEFTMMGFIKGPVCRGQVALNVIQDRFWITFVEPGVRVLPTRRRRACCWPRRRDLDSPAEGSSARPTDSPAASTRSSRTSYLEARAACLAQARQQGHELWTLRRSGTATAATPTPRSPSCATSTAPRGQGVWCGDAQDRLGRRLPAARAHPLPARRRLRRVRQRRPPAEHAPVHGLPAHGGRGQLPHPAAPDAASRDAGPLVPGREPRHARAGLWRPDDDAGRR